MTEDDDRLREAASRHNPARPFVGVIYARAIRVTIGQFVAELELVARASRPEEWVSRVEYLRLK